MLLKLARRYVTAREDMQRIGGQLENTNTDFPSGAEMIREFRNAVKAELEAFEALKRYARSIE